MEQGWCSHVPKLLDLPDHDSLEKVLNAMWTLRDQCQADFIGMLPRLRLLKTKYLELSVTEMEDGTPAEESYFASVLLQGIDRLLEHADKTRDEL